jgi:hypothetical protein
MFYMNMPEFTKPKGLDFTINPKRATSIHHLHPAIRDNYQTIEASPAAFILKTVVDFDTALVEAHNVNNNLTRLGDIYTEKRALVQKGYEANRQRESDSKLRSIAEKGKLRVEKEHILYKLRNEQANARRIIIDHSVQPEIDQPFVHEITLHHYSSTTLEAPGLRHIDFALGNLKERKPKS